MFYSWCCQGWQRGSYRFYRLPSLHVRGSTWATKPSSIRPRSHRDHGIWSCLGSPQPLLNNITITCFCSSFWVKLQRGVKTIHWVRSSAVRLKHAWKQSGFGETHAQIDKHTYGDPQTQWREKKVSVALPPPLQTFLEHLHSLNILAGVKKKKETAPLLSACHVCSLKETSLVLIRASAKSWGNCHFLLWNFSSLLLLHVL